MTYIGTKMFQHAIFANWSTALVTLDLVIMMLRSFVTEKCVYSRERFGAILLVAEKRRRHTMLIPFMAIQREENLKRLLTSRAEIAIARPLNDWI